MIKRVVILLLTIGLVFPFPIFSAVIGEFAVVSGDVAVTRAGKAIKPKAKDKVETLDLIRTGKNSNARVVLTDNTSMALGPNSRLEMKQFAVQGGKTTGLFSVPEGLVQTKVAKALGPGSKFEIQTPTAIAGVRGTAWLTLVELAVQGVAKSSFYALEQSIFVMGPAFPTQVATVVAGNFTVVAAGALPTVAVAFAPATVAGLTATLGSAAIPGVGAAGAAGAAGTTAATGTTATGTAAGTTGAATGTTTAAGTTAGAAGTTTAAGAAGAGTVAGTATVAGVGVGTIATVTVAAAAVVAAVATTSSKNESTTTHSSTTTHH